VCKPADNEGGDVEPTGVQRIPDRWRGEPVEVIHQIQQEDGLSIGPTAGIVEETDDTGILLSVTDTQRGSVEHRFFPWTTIVQIIAPLG
jgi:hypothetical protein